MSSSVLLNNKFFLTALVGGRFQNGKDDEHAAGKSIRAGAAVEFTGIVH